MKPDIDLRRLTINAFIYARMNSARLPGKVLFELGDRTILGHCVEALDHINGLETIVATSSSRSDDAIVEWCQDSGVRCFRGDLDNVALRTYLCLQENPCDAFFRINADSPFLQPILLEKALDAYRTEIEVDMVTNVFRRSYPYGISVELIDAETFTGCLEHFRENEGDFEHITNYFYRNRNSFNIVNIVSQRDLSRDRWVLDTKKDWNRLQVLYSQHSDLFQLTPEELHELTRN